MDKKTTEAVRLRRSCTYLVAGRYRVTSTSLYCALFVDEPRGCYGECSVYRVLCDQGDDDVDESFEVWCQDAWRFKDKVMELLEMFEWLDIVVSACECLHCQAMTDIDDLVISPCCQQLLCRECALGPVSSRDDGSCCCGYCGSELTAVQVLSVLADD